MKALKILLAMAIGCSGLAQASHQRPNIILILADDMGYGDAQAYNPQSRVPTPHLNRLAREGVMFTDAHSGSAVCTPTRYGLITGQQLPDRSAEDSFSFLPSVLGKLAASRAPVIKHSANGLFALREGPWKMVFGNGSGGRQQPRGKPFAKPYQLFNLEQDPSETTNIIDQHPETATRLEKRLQRIREQGRSREL